MLRAAKRRAERNKEQHLNKIHRHQELMQLVQENKEAEEILTNLGDKFETTLELALSNCGPQKRKCILRGLTEKRRGAQRLIELKEGTKELTKLSRTSITPKTLLFFLYEYGNLKISVGE